MRIGDLFLIFIVLIAICLGGIAMMALQPSPTGSTDSFGRAPSENSNRTTDTVQKVGTGTAGMEGGFIVMVAVFIIIVVSMGGWYLIKKGRYGQGKYRTG